LRPSGAGYLEVHPDFRAIFTSNPEEYAGVHKTQDALMDRLITLNLGNFDRETEIQIAMAKSGVSRGTPRSSWTLSASCEALASTITGRPSAPPS